MTNEAALQLSSCVCGGTPVVIRQRQKKMISCPNPDRCYCGCRTGWESSEQLAAGKWETEVLSAAARLQEMGIKPGRKRPARKRKGARSRGENNRNP